MPDHEATNEKETRVINALKAASRSALIARITALEAELSAAGKWRERYERLQEAVWAWDAADNATGDSVLREKLKVIESEIAAAASERA